MNNYEILKNIAGFSWDRHNIQKNWLKHKVKFTECEEIFFNDPIFILKDLYHSQKENRWYALGNTDNKRKLFVVFTVRKDNIRIISARDMSKNERKQHEKLKSHS